MQVASLLVEVLQDNPALSTAYTTGLFFFVLMYMGSNVLPVAGLLHLAHLRQAFRPEEVRSVSCSFVLLTRQLERRSHERRSHEGRSHEGRCFQGRCYEWRCHEGQPLECGIKVPNV